MATKIVTKNSSTASAVPTASDLVQGELAVNVADKRLFTEDNGGSIVELGTNPSTIDINAGTIDGAVIGGTTPAAITGSTVTSTGNIVVTGTVDGRDVATDGTKLDGIEAGADVTDTTNVTAAGALMDSEVTNLAQVKAFDSADYATAAQGTKADAALPTTGGAMTGAITTNSTFDGRDVATDGTKLDGIEAGADVTDTTNVVAALSAGTGISLSAGGEIANTSPDQTVALTGAGTTTITGTYPNFTITSTGGSGGNETLAQTLVLGNTTGGTDLSVSSGDNIVMAASSTVDGRDVSVDGTKLDGIEASADVTDTANVTAAGALMDSELTAIASVKALNQGVATTDSPAFAGIDVTGTATMDGLTVDGLAQISAQTNGAYALRVGDAAGSSGSVVGIGKIGINPQGAGTFTYTGTEIRATENAAGDYRAHLSFHTRGSGSDVEPLKRLDISNNGDISFYEDTGTTAKLFWDASAESLGIGTASPSTYGGKLNITDGAVGGESTLVIANNNANQFVRVGINDNVAQIAYDNADSLAFGEATDSTTAGLTTERMRINSSGNVGIGTTAPAEALHVVGNIVATGNITANYSDNRLKDFQGTIPNALNKVAQLNGYYYTPNETAQSLGVDNNGLEVGISAQEVEAVLPEIVAKSAIGEDYKTVMYEKLTPLLIEAVKELTKKVAKLELRLDKVEK